MVNEWKSPADVRFDIDIARQQSTFFEMKMEQAHPYAFLNRESYN